jgi:hypothetical protein
VRDEENIWDVTDVNGGIFKIYRRR